jgi:hypothetical protein
LAAAREQQQRAACIVLALHTPAAKSSHSLKGANASLTLDKAVLLSNFKNDDLAFQMI